MKYLQPQKNIFLEIMNFFIFLGKKGLRMIEKISDATQDLFVGRVNRLQFLISILMGWVIPFILCIILLVILSKFALFLNIGLSIPFVVYLVLTLICACLVNGSFARRLHDIGMPGWLIFIPIINAFVFFVAFIVPGQKSLNSYGSVPDGRRRIVSVLFNRDLSKTDEGERWIGTLMIILSVIVMFVASMSFLNGTFWTVKQY